MAEKMALNQVAAPVALAVSTSVVSPTLPTGTPRHALIYVGGQPVRWSADGTDPSATTGMFAAAGSYIEWTDPGIDYWGMISKAEFIRDTSATGDAALVFLFFN